MARLTTDGVNALPARKAKRTATKQQQAPKPKAPPAKGNADGKAKAKVKGKANGTTTKQATTGRNASGGNQKKRG